MADLPKIEQKHLLIFLQELLNIPSPTGFTEKGIDYIRAELSQYPPLEITETRQGALLVKWPGLKDDHPRALSAHVDTLGAMVKEIKPNGRLKLFQVGGYAWNTIEGEGCRVFTRGGKIIRGSILLTKSSGHVYGKQVETTIRDEETMEVRLDEQVTSISQTAELGISVGDYVAFDPRVEVVNGFIRSRHLDDKACVACLVEAVSTCCKQGIQPAQTMYLFFSNHEEIGYGAAQGISPEAHEFVSVDMAAVGEGQNSDEHHVTVCLSDGVGPYDRQLSNRLLNLAEMYHLPCKTDIYPHYSSDGTSFLKAGGNARVALIGPGVDASHNYERTHIDALFATTRLIMAYVVSA